MSRAIKNLNISYYEISWITVCRELEEKLNEMIDVMNNQQEQIKLLKKMCDNLHGRLKDVASQKKTE